MRFVIPVAKSLLVLMDLNSKCEIRTAFKARAANSKKYRMTKIEMTETDA